MEKSRGSILITGATGFIVLNAVIGTPHDLTAMARIEGLCITYPAPDEKVGTS